MPIKQQSVEQFAAAVAERSPVPGGGAVAAVTAAHAAALVTMVLEFTVGKPAFAAHDAANRTALERSRAMSRLALDLADRDASAYLALSALLKLPKDSEARKAAWDGTVREAIDAPQAILSLAAEVARMASSLRDVTNPHLASDLTIALELARVAASAAAHNVSANLSSVSDAKKATTYEGRMKDALVAAGVPV